jgi:hypothetical protein
MDRIRSRAAYRSLELGQAAVRVGKRLLPPLSQESTRGIVVDGEDCALVRGLIRRRILRRR